MVQAQCRPVKVEGRSKVGKKVKEKRDGRRKHMHDCLATAALYAQFCSLQFLQSPIELWPSLAWPPFHLTDLSQSGVVSIFFRPLLCVSFDFWCRRGRPVAPPPFPNGRNGHDHNITTVARKAKRGEGRRKKRCTIKRPNKMLPTRASTIGCFLSETCSPLAHNICAIHV